MEKKTNGLVIASWVLFVIGVAFWGWLFPVIGAVLAYFGSATENKKNTPLVANVALTAIIVITYLVLF